MRIILSKVEKSIVALAVCLTMMVASCFSIQAVDALSLPNQVGYVNSSNGAIMRKNATTDSKKLQVLSNDTTLSIKRVVFTSKTSTSAKKRWYYVTANGKTGYIRADLVDGIKYSNATAKITGTVNYRTGPGTTFTKKGCLNKGKTVTVQMIAKRRLVSQLWYRVKIGSKSYYISKKYAQLTSTGSPSASSGLNKNISEVAKALKAKATSGGTNRIVYTFDENNCTKKFGVKGFADIYTPQGLAFTGSEYCVLFATSSGDRLVTYSTNGTRLKEIKFSSNHGHLNGITWDPKTGVYYIFKGNQKTIYTYNPSTGKFGTATTPYSSSGVGYDRVNNVICCSSQTGIRVYSADGKFTHKKLFDRCSYSGTIYIQDCGAHQGYVFHGISGSNKQTSNYIDVYRVSDGKYMGTIKESIGEIESIVVNKDGYLEMLVNTSESTDYIWKTPLKVSELQ